MKTIKLLLFAFAVLLVSCTSRTYEEISEPILTAPTYTKNIEAVIQSNCVGCHRAGGKFPVLESYAQVKDATQNGDLICRIDQTQSCGNVMPRFGAMPRQTIDMIILWQKEGYKN